jgi:hypothetical protein
MIYHPPLMGKEDSDAEGEGEGEGEGVPGVSGNFCFKLNNSKLLSALLPTVLLLPFPFANLVYPS